jgi:WD40 repeat protein
MWTHSYGTYVNDVAYSPAGDVVAVSGWNNTVVLLDALTGSVLHTLTGHTDDVNTITFSPDGQTIASAAGGYDETNDASIKIWQVFSGTLLRTMPGHGDWVYDLDFSPDGAFLLSVGRDSLHPNVDPKIKLWDLSNGSLAAYYDESSTPVSVAYAPDGLSFCYGRSDGELVLASLDAPVAVKTTGGPAATGGVAFGVPNPFNPATTIHFFAAGRDRVKVEVFDVSGRLVKRLLDGVVPAGETVVDWSGDDDAGNGVGSGLYIARITFASGEVLTAKLVLLK